MAMVEFLGPLANRGSIEVNINSLRELKELLGKDAEMQKWLEVCSVAINDKLIYELDTKISQGDKIVILPPVCGG